MRRRFSESTEKYQKVKKNCYEVIDYVGFSKTGVLAESVCKNAQRALRPDKQSEHFSWESPQKQDKSKFYEKVKIRLCIVNNRRRPPIHYLQKQKNWRIHNAGYQICKFNIWWKNAKSYDLRYLPRRSVTAEVRGGAPKAHFLRKLLWIYRFWKIKLLKIEPGKVGVRGGIGG